jgi:molybdate transport system ATP-binding protein
MDEPLAALDHDSKQAILPFLERLHDELELPLLYVSHDPDEVARLADQLALMHEGRIVASGPTAELLTRLDLPLAHSSGAEALIDVQVTGHDHDDHLTDLQFSGGRFTVPFRDLPIGQHVRLRVLARDVSLTRQHQTDTSILNIFPVVATELAEDGPAQLLVRLDANGTPLLARITRRSARLLGLSTGSQLYAQVKSVALLG